MKLNGRMAFYAAILTQQAIGGVGFPVAKLGLAEMPSMAFAAFRFAIASICFLSILLIRGTQAPLVKGDLWRIALLGVVMVYGNQALFLWGQKYTTASHGSLLYALTPAFIFIAATLLLGEQWRWRRALGVCVAVVGAVVIISQRGIALSDETLFGDGIIFISVILWATVIVSAKPLVERNGTVRVTALATIFGTLAFAPVAFFAFDGFSVAQVSVLGWLSVLYMGVLMSVVAYLLWNWAIKRHDASRVGALGSIQPFFATTVAFLALGELPTMTTLIGGALIIGGVVYSELAAQSFTNRGTLAALPPD